MLEIVMVYTDKKGYEQYVLTGEYDELYVLDRDNLSVQNWGIMGSIFDVFEDIDTRYKIYVKDVNVVKEYLEEYRDEIENVDDIINSLKEMR